MNLPQAMSQLAAHFRQPSATPDDHGAYGLRFGPVTVGLRPGPEGDGLVLQSLLGRVAPQDEGLVQSLLAANLVPPSVHSGSLGLDAQMNVFLTLQLPQRALDFPVLLQALGPFVGRARTWQARLAAAVPAVGEPA